MNPIHVNYRLKLSFLIFFLLICISLPVLSQEGISQSSVKTNDISNTELSPQLSPLRKAHLELKNAFDSYKKGDIDTTKQHLKIASDWLNKASQNSLSAKVKDESDKLAVEINSFKEKINRNPEQHENSLARYWHQMTSIIKRETDQLIHSYVKLSIAEKTLNHLLDAKMHLFRTKHDLFVSHDKGDAEYELNKVLKYLDEAVAVADPTRQSGIINLSKDIQRLKDQVSKKKDTWKNDSVVVALDSALENLNNAKQYASPAIKLRIESLKADFNVLRDDIEKTNIRNDYEAAMATLNTIIVNL